MVVGDADEEHEMVRLTSAIRHAFSQPDAEFFNEMPSGDIADVTVNRRQQ
jgi:hypothetical protein